MDDTTLLLGDCLMVMKTLADASVDLVASDPPYGSTACAWDAVIPFEPYWAEIKRVVRSGGAVVLTASQPFTTDLIASNRPWFRYEWIWEKSNGGGFLNANRQPLKRHENVVVFCPTQTTYNPIKSPGKPYRCRRSAAGETTQDQTVAGWITENDGDRYPTTVLRFASETGLHPTQKPVALFEYLVRTYSHPGDLVLDPSMGSATTGIACINTHRRFVGIEKDPAIFATARARVAATALPLFDPSPSSVVPNPSLAPDPTREPLAGQATLF